MIFVVGLLGDFVVDVSNSDAVNQGLKCERYFSHSLIGSLIIHRVANE